MGCVSSGKRKPYFSLYMILLRLSNCLRQLPGTTRSDRSLSMVVRARHNVVVVGAGWAGLAAAKTICDEGLDRVNVTVVEASQRVGGRVNTVEVRKVRSDHPAGSDPLQHPNSNEYDITLCHHGCSLCSSVWGARKCA